MDDNRPGKLLEIVAFRGPRDTVTYVIEVTEFNFDVRNNLRGHLASEDTLTKNAILKVA